MNKRQRKKRDKKNRELMVQFCDGLKKLALAAKECALVMQGGLNRF